jgi:hypothetical protein
MRSGSGYPVRCGSVRSRHGPWRSLVSASDWGLAAAKRCADLRKCTSAASEVPELCGADPRCEEGDDPPHHPLPAADSTNYAAGQTGGRPPGEPVHCPLWPAPFPPFVGGAGDASTADALPIRNIAASDRATAALRILFISFTPPLYCLSCRTFAPHVIPSNICLLTPIWGIRHMVWRDSPHRSIPEVGKTIWVRPSTLARLLTAKDFSGPGSLHGRLPPT